MSRQNKPKGKNIWLNVRLDPELDADLIAWLESFRDGERSTAIRAAIRQAIATNQQAPNQRATAFNLEAIRSVVAEEILKALATKGVSPMPQPAAPEKDDLEARYGSKLDQMMGGLIKRQDGDET